MTQRAAAVERQEHPSRARASVLLLALALVTSAAHARDATPEIEAFWRTCTQKVAGLSKPDFYRVRYFGSDAATARRLLDLILSGEKTVTFTTPWLYQDDPNRTPVVGGYTVVTDSDGRPEVLLRTTQVKTLAFSEVTEEDARFEGPGARTVEAWRRIHWNFFTNGLKPLGKQPTEDMPVTVEHFEVVCKL